MNTTRSILFISIASLLLSGCATPQRSEYATLAQAGSGYAAAVDKLLVAAGEAQVDSSSWTLVSARELTGVVSKEKYRERAKEDAERLITIKRLREHAGLLADYFGELESLATSDAPEETKKSVEGVVKSIDVLSSELQTSSPNVFEALPPLAKIVVDTKIRRALRNELEKRKNVIRKELQFQKVLLEILGDQISRALRETKDIKEQEIILKPLLYGDSPLAKPETWVAKRREVMYLPLRVEEVKSASKIAEKMNEVFEDLLSGKVDSVDRINALITDIESLLAVADAINS